MGSSLLKTSPVSSLLPSSPHLSIAVPSSLLALQTLLMFFLPWILLTQELSVCTLAGKQAYGEPEKNALLNTTGQVIGKKESKQPHQVDLKRCFHKNLLYLFLLISYPGLILNNYRLFQFKHGSTLLELGLSGKFSFLIYLLRQVISSNCCFVRPTLQIT